MALKIIKCHSNLNGWNICLSHERLVLSYLIVMCIVDERGNKCSSLLGMHSHSV